MVGIHIGRFAKGIQGKAKGHVSLVVWQRVILKSESRNLCWIKRKNTAEINSQNSISKHIIFKL